MIERLSHIRDSRPAARSAGCRAAVCSVKRPTQGSALLMNEQDVTEPRDGAEQNPSRITAQVAGLNSSQHAADAHGFRGCSVYHQAVDGPFVYNSPEDFFRTHSYRLHKNRIVDFIHVIFMNQGFVESVKAASDSAGYLGRLQIEPPGEQNAYRRERQRESHQSRFTQSGRVCASG